MKILVADDEKSVRWAAEKVLQKENFEVVSASDGEEALKIIKEENPEIAVLDIRMPKKSGMEVLKYVKNEEKDVFVIIISAYGDMDTTIEAMKLGAYDFLLKPFDIKQLVSSVKKAKRAYENLKKLKDKKNKTKENKIIGKSPKMQEIYKLVGKIATSDVTVLITGESGVGKEVIARAIHYNSLRADKPFMAINCTALQENLIESELFGHEKGAFTGAYTQKLGKFELANGGTVFLDEIGDMSFELQAKLLRVMEERKFTRVGGVKEIDVDIRIIAATNKNLEKAIEEGKFREDLYHRIKVININIPPLRERKEDIPALAEYFLNVLSLKNSFEYSLSKEALKKLLNYDWPGNVRELKNVIESAVAISRDGTIFPEHILIDKSEKKTKKIGDLDFMIEKEIEFVKKNKLKEYDLYDKIISYVEKKVILKVYEEFDKNQLKTSKILGINRNTLRTKLEKYKGGEYES